MHTGDLAVMNDDGYVRIVGRIKDMIIRGGENVYPREIEEFLYSHPKIADVQVVGVPDEKYGEEIAACVILRDPARPAHPGRVGPLLPLPARPLQGAAPPARSSTPRSRMSRSSASPTRSTARRSPPASSSGTAEDPLTQTSWPTTAAPASPTTRCRATSRSRRLPDDRQRQGPQDRTARAAGEGAGAAAAVIARPGCRARVPAMAAPLLRDVPQMDRPGRGGVAGRAAPRCEQVRRAGAARAGRRRPASSAGLHQRQSRILSSACAAATPSAGSLRGPWAR